MSAIFMLLRRAAWAPVLVVVVHQIVLRTPWRAPLDFAMHFSGGMAIAYFFFHGLECFGPQIGKLTKLGHFLFSVALACTLGVFWEFGELFSDTVLHTRIQRSVSETMWDLIADTTGALFSLFLVFAYRLVRRR